MTGSPVRRIAVAAVWFALQGCAAGAGLRAQSSPSPDLDRIEAVADSGRAEEAARELSRWFEGRADRASPDDRVRARFLRARLTQDADSARAEYLWIAIDGGAEHGAAAWLKLAQLDLATGNPERALQDLARLRDDYPGSPLVPDSWLWAGWAQEAAGRLEDGCRSWERAERAAARQGDREVEERAREARTRCAAGELRLTVQLGAFRTREAALGLRERAREAGFDARVEAEGGLHRVRVGRFGTPDSARDIAQRLREAGFSAVVMAGES